MQRHFRVFQPHVEGRLDHKAVVPGTHARLQILLSMRFLSLLMYCARSVWRWCVSAARSTYVFDFLLACQNIFLPWIKIMFPHIILFPMRPYLPTEQ